MKGIISEGMKGRSRREERSVRGMLGVGSGGASRLVALFVGGDGGEGMGCCDGFCFGLRPRRFGGCGWGSEAGVGSEVVAGVDVVGTSRLSNGSSNWAFTGESEGCL